MKPQVGLWVFGYQGKKEEGRKLEVRGGGEGGGAPTREQISGSNGAKGVAPTPHPLNLPGYLLHLSSLGNIDQLPKSITDLNLSDTKLEGR